MVYIFLDDGFEEIEALTVVDLLRRACIDIKTISLKKNNNIVCGANNICVNTDDVYENIINIDDVSMIILPGGPAVQKLCKNEWLLDLIKKIYDDKKFIAAICAAPMILGQLNLLKNLDAVCYPSYEKYLLGANVLTQNVVVSDNIITSRGAGTSIDFSLKIIEILKSKEISEEIAKKIVYKK